MGTEAIAVLGVAVSALAIFYLAVFGQNSLADHIRAARVRKEILRTKRIESTAADRVMANLPTPEYIEFVGRNDEVARLESILRPYPHSQHSVVAIDGLGGAGKSALALYVAIRAVERAASEQPPDRFAAVIWISAKERLISATGTYTRKRQERTLEDIFETIAICLGRQDITRAPTETQVELVRSALAAQRTLLVFDNMETIDDENVYAFLRELPAPTKAIVTSRMQLDVAYSIHLDGLNPDAAARVFRTQAGSAATSPDSRLNTLIDRSEGLPLVMVWSAARMRLGDTLDDVLKRIEGRRGEALVEYSFGGIWANMMLDEDLRHVLIAAACLPSPASSEIVAEACDMSNDEARKHLLELSRSRLVSRADDQWRLQSLVRACTLRESSADEHAQLLARASRALVERLRSIVGDERVSAISATQYGLIDRDRDNVVYLIDWNASRGAWDIVRGLVGGLGYYLHARGLWANAVRTWEVGALAAQQLDDPRYEARFRTYLGYMAYFMGHPERAAAYAQEASKLVEGGDDVYQIASVLRLHGYLARERGEVTAALQIFEESLTIMESAHNNHGVCRLNNDIAETDLREGLLESAEARAKLAFSLADSGDELIERVRSTVVLAEVSLRRRDMSAAASQAEQAKSDALASGWWEDAGSATLLMARANADSNRQLAIELATEAQGYFDRVGSARRREECTSLVRALRNPRRRGGRRRPHSDHPPA